MYLPGETLLLTNIRTSRHTGPIAIPWFHRATRRNKMRTSVYAYWLNDISGTAIGVLLYRSRVVRTVNSVAQLVPLCILGLSDANKRCYGDARLFNEVASRHALLFCCWARSSDRWLKPWNEPAPGRSVGPFRAGGLGWASANVASATDETAQNRISSGYIAERGNWCSWRWCADWYRDDACRLH